MQLLKRAWMDVGHSSEQGRKKNKSIINSKQKSCSAEADASQHVSAEGNKEQIMQNKLIVFF